MKQISIFSRKGMTLLWGGIVLGVAPAISPVRAQMHNPQKVDSVLVAEHIEGNMRIRQYRINEASDADYTMLYRINLAKLTSQLGENSRELRQLDSLMKGLAGDSTLQVKRITITGYASPDGPEAFNERLAKARTSDFVAYATKRYPILKQHPPITNSVCEPWSSCRGAVLESKMADRQAVVRLLDEAGLTPEERQHRLEAMPAAWALFKSEILPPMRRVEVAVTYSRSHLEEQRTTITPPKPEPRPAPQPTVAKKAVDSCGECLVVDEAITGFIIEYPQQ